MIDEKDNKDSNNNNISLNPIQHAIDLDDKDLLNKALEGKALSNEKILIIYDGMNREIHPLFYASYKGSINCLKYLIEEKKVNPLLRNEHGSIFLHWLNENPKEIVNYAHKKKISLNIENKYGSSPLFMGVQNNNFEVVKALLNMGSQVNAQNEDGNTALLIAVETGNIEIIKYLIWRNAGVNIKNNEGIAPIHIAAKKKDETIIKILIASKELEDLATPNGCHALHFAANYGHENIVSILIDSRVEIDAVTKNKWSPLHYAASKGHIGAVKTLINAGANIDLQTNRKDTSLNIALLNGYTEIANFLIERGAEVNIQNVNKVSPLHIAIMKGHTDIAITLIENGAKADVQDNEGHTALHMAAQQGYFNIAKKVIEKGANVDLLVQNSWASMHIAAGLGHFEIVKLLIKAGAKLNYGKDKLSPIHLAIAKANIETVKLLVEADNNLDYNDNNKEHNLLMLACGIGKDKLIALNGLAKKNNSQEIYIPTEQEYKECVKYLLMTHKVDPLTKALYNRDALRCAKDANFTEIINILKVYSCFKGLMKGTLYNTIFSEVIIPGENMDFFKDLSISYFFNEKLQFKENPLNKYINKLKFGLQAYTDGNQELKANSYFEMLQNIEDKIFLIIEDSEKNLLPLETHLVFTYEDEIYSDITSHNTEKLNKNFSGFWPTKKDNLKSEKLTPSKLGLNGIKFIEGEDQQTSDDIHIFETYGSGLILLKFLEKIDLNNITKELLEPMLNKQVFDKFSNLFDSVKYNLDESLKSKGEAFIKLVENIFEDFGLEENSQYILEIEGENTDETIIKATNGFTLQPFEDYIGTHPQIKDYHIMGANCCNIL
jgi:ankyrin repeat protein